MSVSDRYSDVAKRWNAFRLERKAAESEDLRVRNRINAADAGMKNAAGELLGRVGKNVPLKVVAVDGGFVVIENEREVRFTEVTE